MPPTHTYRPDIDGLRALAVLGVVLFHAGLGVPGGFVGVDVFFVISGFLITRLILKELAKGTFSLLDFWERRARRILPALVAVVLAVLTAGWFLLLPTDYALVGKRIISLVALSSNVQFWRESGYFGEAAEEKPLLHTWSLSLEEQFYVIIPLLLILLYRCGKGGWTARVLLGIATASFILAVIGSSRAPTATFYLLPTRAWELAAGSLLAFARPLPSAPLRAAMSWAGLAGIVLPFFLYHEEIRFPGLAALPPVVGATLFIWSGMRPAETAVVATLPGRLLATRPLVAIGLLSYSLYLWHWPIFAFRDYLSDAPPTLGVRLAGVALSLALAALSLRFIERPFRSRSHFRTRRQVFTLSLVALATIALPALALWLTAGQPHRVSPAARLLAAGENDWVYRRADDLEIEDIPDHLLTLGAAGARPRIFVWGDSHARAILPAIDVACQELGIGAVAATRSATPPVLDWWRSDDYAVKSEGPPYNRAVLDAIRALDARDGLSCVILAAKWSDDLEVSTPDRPFKTALVRTLDELEQTGCKILVLREVPNFTFDPPKTLALHSMWGHDLRQFQLPLTSYAAFSKEQVDLFSSLATVLPQLIVINPGPALAAADGPIRPAHNGRAIYRDEHHLTTYGSMRLKETFRRQFATSLASPVPAAAVLPPRKLKN